MRALVVAMMVAALGGCAAARSPAVEREPVARDGCDRLAIEAPPTVARVWDGTLSTGGRLEATLRSCSDEPLGIESASFRAGEGSIDLAFDPESARIAPGGSMPLSAPAPGRLGPAVLVVRAQGGIERSVSIEIVDDPRRLQAIASCDACGGRFGPVGMMGTEACDCPTRDAGARCLSDGDCEGACLFDRVERAPSPRCAAGEVLHTRVGRCHDRQHLFGCHPRLTDPISECAPPGTAMRQHSVCVD